MSGQFDTTRWSVVLAAGGDDSAARAALSTLCQTYWYPLYAYVRRRGVGADDAADLTQGFITSLLERRDIETVRPERGRFRSFLLASLNHFLINESVRARAAKRGGGAAPVPLTFDDAEGRYLAEPAEPSTPETLYERRWALTVIECVMAELRVEWQLRGRKAEFDALKPCLLQHARTAGYADVAARLGTSEGAVRTAVHRLRRGFQAQLRRHIEATVASRNEVDAEIRFLLRALER
jgi:RNA polymerase sigma-70 factor (ECF subfamily)